MNRSAKCNDQIIDCCPCALGLHSHNGGCRYFHLDHPRPHAEWCDRISNPAARKSIHNYNCSLRSGEKSVGTRSAGKYNSINCRSLNETKCSSCSPPAGRMTFARWTKPKAVCRGTTLISPLSQQASQQTSRPCNQPRIISSQR